MRTALTPIHSAGDQRGRLSAIETGREVPFSVERVYYLTGTAPDQPRGFHAHYATQQFATCLRGSCRLVLETPGGDRWSVELNNPAMGFLIDAMMWHEMHDFEPGTIMLVLADRHYDESDYIRSYEAWRDACGSNDA